MPDAIATPVTNLKCQNTRGNSMY